MTEDSIGVDVSKDNLDAHRLSDGASARFANTAKGFRALAKWLGCEPPARVVYEPTGPYHAAFEKRFAGKLPLVKVNPLQAHRFAQSKGMRAKTDKADARVLALMGAAFTLEPDAPMSQNLRDLKELRIARSALVKDRTRLKNRLHTLTLAFAVKQAKARLALISRQLIDIDVEIAACIAKDQPIAHKQAILRSIPGIGEVAAAAILIECPEVGTMTGAQIASLSGLAPMTRQSGKWTGKAFIQGGRKHLRDALYMPALVAARFNPDLKRKYQAMIANGKPPKVALTALMRKLIELANTLVQNDRKWVPKDT